MLILIDRDELRMVAAASNRRWINLIGYVDYSGKRLVVADSLEGKTWTVLDSEEMATLYRNMSGQEPPPYAQAIEQLRAYADTWPNYPKSEVELEREAEAIYAQELAEAGELDDAELVQDNIRARERTREIHQQCIEMAEEANSKLSPEQRQQAAVSAAPAPKPHAAQGEAAARPRGGITKLIWDIADQLYAVEPGRVKSDFKGFRSEVISRAAAQGANSGTAATQFGHWKRDKGL